MKTRGFIVGTDASTILITPPNFSFMLTSFYVGNTGTTTADTSMLTLQAYNRDASTGSVTGTVNVGYFPQGSGFEPVNQDDSPAVVFPTGSYIIATASSSSLTFTFNGSYVYYRE